MDTTTDNCYLGRLCKRNHDHAGTGKSLRYKADRSCIKCKMEYGKSYATSERGRDVLREASRKFSLSQKRKEWEQAYRHTERGQDVIRNAQLNYRNTDNGLARRKEAENRYAKTEKRRISLRRKHARRRALIASNHEKYSEAEVSALIDRWDGQCAYCYRNGATTLDHVVPLIKGGADAIKNLAPACFTCNSSKCSTDAYKWYSKRPYFTEERWQAIKNWTAG